MDWIMTRGTPPPLSTLEEKLEEMKALSAAKAGDTWDCEYVPHDGINWIIVRGVAPSTSALENKLNEVKALYHMKTGLDVAPCTQTSTV